jgi:hypothetical protein
LEQPLSEQVSESEGTYEGGQSIAWVISFVGSIFDPLLNQLKTILNLGFHP